MVRLPPRRAGGFTIMELLFTMAVLAILAGLAAPSVTEMVARQRLRSAASDIVTSLALTRSSAATLRVPVTMSPTLGGTDWSGGWSIPHPDAALPVIYVQSALKKVAASGPTSVTFTLTGRTTSTDPLKWKVTVDGTDQVRCVELELNGTPYQSLAECS